VIEWRHVRCISEHLGRCAIHAAETVVLLSESQSRQALVEATRLAIQSHGCAMTDMILPTPASAHAVPIRSTGASQAIAGNRAVLAALTSADLVVDCTVEGLLHAPELARVLDSGARVLMISNEHLDVFERLGWDDTLPPRVDAALARLRTAKEMRLLRDTGTDLRIRLAGAFTAGSTGLTDGPGSIAHWPGGLVLAFPAAGSVNGTLVLAPGDLNLTFNRFVTAPINLSITDDYITEIAGEGVDAQLFRGYLEAFGDRECLATSHVGWGLNRQARWESVELYDRRETWGTEARAIAGNVLYSCGANEVAGRFTAGHFDLPMRGCTVLLDDAPVVVAGRLVDQ
jgi:2,5-dihydroxypyridine 5,6-dioxygenase